MYSRTNRKIEIPNIEKVLKKINDRIIKNRPTHHTIESFEFFKDTNGVIKKRLIKVIQTGKIIY
jgi:hypothetical protein